MNRRVALAGVGSVAVLGLLAGSLPGIADSSTTTTGSAHSAAATVNSATSGLTVTSSGTLAGVNLTSLTTNLINPLVNGLTALPQSLVNSLVSGLAGTSLQADNPASQQQRPATGTYPTCGQQGWSSTDCYGPLTPSISAAPALTVSTGATQGYATGDSAGYIAAAHTANPNISLLSLNLGNLGVVDSSAQCSTSTCSATQSLTGGSLLGGAVTVSVANGTQSVKVNGTSLPSGSTSITWGGLATTVTVNGNLLTLKITLGLSQVLTALGLPNLLTSVLSLLGLGNLADNGSTATLTVKIGPGSTVNAATSASSWGLEVSADLAATLKIQGFNLLGLLSVGTITISATGASSPDLFDLKLAYSSATLGTLPAGWVPPGVI